MNCTKKYFKGCANLACCFAVSSAVQSASKLHENCNKTSRSFAYLCSILDDRTMGSSEKWGIGLGMGESSFMARKERDCSYAC
jgi:hypothetical protein